MITILVEFTFLPENREEAKGLLKELVDESIKEDGCLFYDAKQDLSDTNTFVLYEVFENQEAQDFHKTTKHYEDVLKRKLSPIIQKRKIKFLV